MKKSYKDTRPQCDSGSDVIRLYVAIGTYGHLAASANVSYVDRLDAKMQSPNRLRKQARSTAQPPRNNEQIAISRFPRKLLI